MNNFIEVTNKSGWKRLVNTNLITDIVGSRIYINCVVDKAQIFIDCRESYDQIKAKIWK